VLFQVTGVLLGKGPIHDTFTIIRSRTYAPVEWRRVVDWGQNVIKAMRKLWADESGQDVAEYAVMLAVILVIVIGTVRLIGGNANNVFSQVGSQMAN
jgi:Flp pilus assembly pilin Flp